MENQLVDELKTSDDYLLENNANADIYEIKYTTKKSVMEKLGFQMQQMVDKWRYG